MTSVRASAAACANAEAKPCRPVVRADAVDRRSNRSRSAWWAVARRPDYFWWHGLAAAAFLLLCGFIAMIFIAHLNRTGRRLRLALMGLFSGPRLLRLRAQRARLLKELQGL